MFLLQHEAGDGLANSSSKHVCSDRSLHGHCPFESEQVPPLSMDTPQMLWHGLGNTTPLLAVSHCSMGVCSGFKPGFG